MKRSDVITCLILAGILAFSGINLVAAQDEEDMEARSDNAFKEIVGNVVYYTPRNNPRVIAIGHDETNTDYAFLITEDTRIEHKKSIRDIAVGDTVKVVYLRLTKIDNRRRKSEELVAKVISFIRAAKKPEPRKTESEPDSETENIDILVSEENG